ncbi:MAG: hypothetical protein ACOC56_00435 [Atribacterota bacterium]
MRDKKGNRDVRKAETQRAVSFSDKSLLLILSLSILIIFSCSQVYAQPPQTNLQVFTADNKITISYPKVNIKEYNRDFSFNFRTFNVSSGKFMDDESQVCNVTFIDNNGEIVYQESSEYNSSSKFWNNNINRTYFNEVGKYRYEILCIDGDIDGFVSGDYELTETGEENFESTFIILIILLAFGTGFIGFFGKNIWVSTFGGFLLLALGIFLTTQGIAGFNNFITNFIAMVSIGLGALFSLYPLVEWIEETI